MKKILLILSAALLAACASPSGGGDSGGSGGGGGGGGGGTVYTEGTTNAPVVVTPGVNHTMTISSYFGEQYSYYKFTANATGTATISYAVDSISSELFGNADFASNFVSGETHTLFHEFDASVTSGTPYYLALRYQNGSVDEIIHPTLSITIVP